MKRKLLLSIQTFCVSALYPGTPAIPTLLLSAVIELGDSVLMCIFLKHNRFEFDVFMRASGASKCLNDDATVKNIAKNDAAAG